MKICRVSIRFGQYKKSCGFKCTKNELSNITFLKFEKF